MTRQAPLASQKGSELSTLQLRNSVKFRVCPNFAEVTFSLKDRDGCFQLVRWLSVNLEVLQRTC